MKLMSHCGRMIGKMFWASMFMLAFVLSLSARDDFQTENAVPREHRPQLVNHLEVTRYVMDFDGDHSLDVATVVEQDFPGYASYSVQLRLGSGAEQSIVVAAPAGGLRIEMHDMTGDKVPNDLLLRPALLHRPPTVLLNDGHEHFTVAISATDPGSISSGQVLAPRGSNGRGTMGLMSSGFRPVGLAISNELFPQLKEILFSLVSQLFSNGSEHTASSGRAPPASQPSI